jgi:L-threonylcarbamoyladenylate synthase
MTIDTINTLCFTKKNLDIDKIKSLFEMGKIIAFPTETVYGIGALISKKEAIEKIYKIKNRDKNKSFIVHLRKIEDIEKVAEDIPKEFYILAKYFMPGPLTLILKKKKNFFSFLKETVAVRIPANGITLKILYSLKEPIIGTSANISNMADIIDPKEILKNFDKKIDAIIDGGICPIGIPSTILDLTKMKILREGFIKKRDIERVLKKDL